MEIRPENDRTPITIASLSRDKVAPSYFGTLLLFVLLGHLRIVLSTDLETYVKGVLQSEVPGNYQLEAVKAQAVASRTYALNSRVDHSCGGCQVCDSYLCCQYFAGSRKIGTRHLQAIEETSGQVLVYAEKPVLALFSSCSGGHTENYDTCFSDPKTGAFPPPPIPYLRGVAEGSLPYDSAQGTTENDLRRLFVLRDPDTVDAWSPNFRWHQEISASALRDKCIMLSMCCGATGKWLRS